MSTIKMHATTRATPEQYTAGLTDFGPGRSKIFGNSADSDLKVHEQGPGHADVTEGSGGVWERLAYDWSDPNHVVARTTDSNTWGGRSGHTYTFTRRADGTDGHRLRGRARGQELQGQVPRRRPRQRRQEPPGQGVQQQRQRDRGPELPGDRIAVIKLLRNLAAGALAGGVGTAAMDLLLYERYQRPGGKDGLWRWEFAGDVMSWQDVSAPGKLGHRALRAAIGHEPPDQWARATTNIAHRATGVGWGLQYGAVANITSRRGWAHSRWARWHG